MQNAPASKTGCPFPFTKNISGHSLSLCKKYMQFCTACLILLLLLFSHIPATQASSLDNFKIEKEKEAKKRKKRSPGKTYSRPVEEPSYRNSYSDEDSNILAEIIFKILEALAIHNMKTGYSQFPYANRAEVSRLITIPPKKTETDNNDKNIAESEEQAEVQSAYYSASTDELIPSPYPAGLSEAEGLDKSAYPSTETVKLERSVSPGYFVRYNYSKFWMYQLSTAYQYVPEGTHAGELELHGKFIPLLGPEASCKVYSDLDDTLYHFRLGFNYTIFQYGGFLSDWYLQLCAMDGMISDSGAATGFILQLYPVKPLTLKLRYGWEFYDENTFTDVELRAGIQFQNWEFFTGYQTFSDGGAELGGFKAGVTLTF